MTADNESKSNVSDGRGGCVRYILASLLSVMCALIYAMRFNLSVSITAMVNSTRFEAAPTSNDTCRDPNLHVSTTESKSVNFDGEFDWDEHEQAMVLYAFFLGYLIFQVPGGYLADKYSVTWVLGASLGLTSAFTCLTAWAARTHIYALLAVRFLEGLFEGLWFPCLYNFSSRWIPMKERGFLMNAIFMGASLGTLITMTGSAYLCDSSLGWPASFSVFGIIGIVCTILWLIIGADGPEHHRWISPRERDYILKDITWTRSQKATRVPWKEILLSPAVWILNFESVCGGLNFYIIATELPSYLKSMFGIHIIDNGFISGGLALGNAISSVVCGWAGDEILKRELTSRNFLRKFAAGIGCLVPAICLLIVAQVGCRYEVIVALIFLNSICGGASGVGDAMVPLDIGPNYPGIVYGMMNCVGNIAGFGAPYLVGYLTHNNNTIHQWNLVFSITGIIGAIGILTFIVFGSTERQKFNGPISDEEDDGTGLRQT